MKFLQTMSKQIETDKFQSRLSSWTSSLRFRLIWTDLIRRRFRTSDCVWQFASESGAVWDLHRDIPGAPVLTGAWILPKYKNNVCKWLSKCTWSYWRVWLLWRTTLHANPVDSHGTLLAIGLCWHFKQTVPFRRPTEVPCLPSCRIKMHVISLVRLGIKNNGA